MTLGAVTGVLIYKQGALGSIVGKMAGSGIIVLAFLIAFYKKHSLRFEWRLLKPMLKYGLPLIPFGLLGITIQNLDRFFIERYFNLQVLGQYNVAFLISTIPFILLNAFQSSINPGILKLLENTKSNNKVNAYKEISGNFRLMIFFMGITLLAMITLSGVVVMFYVGEEYREIIKYLPILILAFIPLIYQSMYSLLLFYHYQSKLLPLLSLFTLIVAVGLNMLLIPLYGVYGVAFAVLGKNIVYAICTFIAVKKKGFYVPEMFDLGKVKAIPFVISGCGLVAFIFIYMYPQLSHLITGIIGSLTGAFLLFFFRSEVISVFTSVKMKFNF
ncbi:hypothetical protein GCM10011323_31390 [Pontibacter amylolyticus]|uniref:Polysaccharide biosynthesis protein C-terminal domain-containing protein n=2 Tax=Pontibacter amylolyticus TaxID=1424080 RepID=A0ABQ1WDL7_9BACT|nr:hypothetical protein GCM10011323_31390 [Pontibacter amylolyticus]